MTETTGMSAKEKVLKVWPKALAIESEVGGWFISLGLKDGRELAYRPDGDIEKLWEDAALNVNKFPDAPIAEWDDARIAPQPGESAEAPKEDKWRPFTGAALDEMCCEWGPPEYVATEDGEAWYWRFPGHDLPVADNLSELLFAAREMNPETSAAQPSQPVSPQVEWTSKPEEIKEQSGTVRRLDSRTIDGKLYVRWEYAGGPNQCKHGYAACFACPDCDRAKSQPPTPALEGTEPATDPTDCPRCKGLGERNSRYLPPGECARRR